MRLKELYGKVLTVDRRIRSAALVDREGKILFGGMREGVEPVEPLEKTASIIAKLVSQEAAMARSEFLGDPEYAVHFHERLIALVFYLRDKAFLVTAERDFPQRKIMAVKELVERYKKPKSSGLERRR